MDWVDHNLATGGAILKKIYLVNDQKRKKTRWKDYDQKYFSKFLKIIQGMWIKPFPYLLTIPFTLNVFQNDITPADSILLEALADAKNILNEPAEWNLEELMQHFKIILRAFEEIMHLS